mgnify:CR=1 FL=1
MSSTKCVSHEYGQTFYSIIITNTLASNELIEIHSNSSEYLRIYATVKNRLHKSNRITVLRHILCLLTKLSCNDRTYLLSGCGQEKKVIIIIIITMKR